MRTKRLAMWPKPPWCISLKAAQKIAGRIWRFVLDTDICFFGFTFYICHFDFVPDPAATAIFHIFADGVEVNTGPYPTTMPGTPVAGLIGGCGHNITGTMDWTPP